MNGKSMKGGRVQMPGVGRGNNPASHRRNAAPAGSRRRTSPVGHEALQKRIGARLRADVLAKIIKPQRSHEDEDYDHGPTKEEWEKRHK